MQSAWARARRAAALAVAIATTGLAAGCGLQADGSTDAGSAAADPGADAGPAGGPVPGPPDQHCALPDGGVAVVVTHAEACTAEPDGHHTHEDAGTSDAPLEPEYGQTLFNASGCDDECKFDVSFTATTIRVGQDVHFTVVGATLAEQAPMTAAGVRAEVFLSDVHPAPNTGAVTTETTPGTYRVGPIRFDAPGRWTVRFHFYEECSDAEGSPHSHVAFYVDVP